MTISGRLKCQIPVEGPSGLWKNVSFRIQIPWGLHMEPWFLIVGNSQSNGETEPIQREDNVLLQSKVKLKCSRMTALKIYLTVLTFQRPLWRPEATKSPFIWALMFQPTYSYFFFPVLRVEFPPNCT